MRHCHPAGLANASGLVGRNLMLHPWPFVRGYAPHPVDGDRGPVVTIFSKQFYETDPARDFVRGYMLQFSRVVGWAGEAIFGAETGAIPWGEGHHAALRERVFRRLSIGVACEDLPEPHNRVTLDPVLKDSDGIPAARSVYRLSSSPLTSSSPRVVMR